MTDESLRAVDGLAFSCTSAEAITHLQPLAEAHQRGARAWWIGTEDGCDDGGRSTRWELRFDLADHRQELVASIGFPVSEVTGERGSGVASLRFLPYPAEGSELARMVRAGQISGRRLRSVWRQQLREHEPLPWDFPDSSTVARVVAPDPIRAAYARMTRQRGFCWVVETPGQTRHLRVDDL